MAPRIRSRQSSSLPRNEGGVALDWHGRVFRPGDGSATQAPSLSLVERWDVVPGQAASGRLIAGDALDVARALAAEGLAGGVDLVYVDPPFASQASYDAEVRLDGPADGRVRRTRAYDDSWPDRGGNGDTGIAAYLEMLAPRLEAMAALLAPTGSLWVHLDWRAAYLVRVLLDEIFGRKSFLNEIVWRRAPNLGRQATSGQFGRTLDTLLVYGGREARLIPPTRLEPVPASAIRRDEEGRAFTTAPRGDYTDESMAKLARAGRVHETASGRKYVKYFLVENADGELCRERRVDTLWTDISPLRHAPVFERTGYPTQKPRALLERIVQCATPPGGLVVDLFAGSGTTGEAAHALGRRFILGDKSPVALNAARARLARTNVPFDVGRCGAGADVPEGNGARVDVTGDSRARDVELLHPEEPLLWAVAPRAAPHAVFVPTWHGERRLGATPIPASRRAVVSLDGPLAVRVYGDDGSVSETVVTDGRQRTEVG
jgi:DNA modification methylase